MDLLYTDATAGQGKKGDYAGRSEWANLGHDIKKFGLLLTPEQLEADAYPLYPGDQDPPPHRTIFELSNQGAAGLRPSCTDCMLCRIRPQRDVVLLAAMRVLAILELSSPGAVGLCPSCTDCMLCRMPPWRDVVLLVVMNLSVGVLLRPAERIIILMSFFGSVPFPFPL